MSNFAALALAGLAGYALGFRYEDLVFALFLGVWPALQLVLRITIRLFPVDLELTNDVHALLYGVPDAHLQAVPGEALRSQLAADAGRESRRVSGFLQIFSCASFEEGLLKGIMILLFACAFWRVGQDVFYRVRPDVPEIRTGPRGFPLRAELRENGIVFTNMSSVRWACDIWLGGGEPGDLQVSLRLPAQATRSVDYDQFLPPSSQEQPGSLRAIARDALDAKCTEPSGREHDASLK